MPSPWPNPSPSSGITSVAMMLYGCHKVASVDVCCRLTGQEVGHQLEQLISCKGLEGGGGGQNRSGGELNRVVGRADQVRIGVGSVAVAHTKS